MSLEEIISKFMDEDPKCIPGDIPEGMPVDEGGWGLVENTRAARGNYRVGGAAPHPMLPRWCFILF